MSKGEDRARTGGADPRSDVVETDRLIAEFTHTIGADPGNALAYRNRGLQYGRKGDYDRALLDLHKVLSLTPDDPRAFGLRGMAWQQKHEHKLAIADFDRAIELDPDNAHIYRGHRERSVDKSVAGDAPTDRADARGVSRNPGAFDLLSNPFILLGVAITASPLDVKHAYEDALEDGIASANELQRARQVLLTPRLRLDAEIAGLLDVPPGSAAQIVAQLRNGATYADIAGKLGSFPALPRANMIAHLGSGAPLGLEQLLKLLEAQVSIGIGAVCDAINETREEAESARVERDAVADALLKLEDRQAKAVIETIVEDIGFATTVTGFVKAVIAKADPSEISKLESYVRAYTHAVSAELSRRHERVIAACDAVRKNPKDRATADRIAVRLRSWNEIGQPLQLFEAHRNREEPQAHELYVAVRDLCIWLANEHSEYETAKRITQACADVFSNLPRSIGQMHEETELLNKLGNERQTVELLTPLSKVCEQAQESHAVVESALKATGFCPSAAGIVGRLYREFADAVELTKDREFADVPWRMVRQLAISLNNESNSPQAAAAIIDGLLEYLRITRPSKEFVQILESDKKAARKNIVQGQLNASIADGRLAQAATQVETLLGLEEDTDERASLRQIQDAIAARRRSRTLKGWGWGIAAVVVLLIVTANQDSRPTYSPSSSRTGSSSTAPSGYAPIPSTPPSVQRPQPAPPSSVDRTPVAPPQPAPPPTAERPPVGTDVQFTQANIRYCMYQRVRLEAARLLISSESAQLAFNAFVDDWNSRCSSYRYRPSDKTAVEAEVAGRRAALESDGRKFADTWTTPPQFAKAPLTIETAAGPRRFTVELARTQPEWSWGTSFRSSMPPDAGMLYVYPAPRTMNNAMATAYFSLDVLFLDANGVIAEIVEQRPAKSSDVVRSRAPGIAMIELNAGTVARLGIKVGDVVRTSVLSGTTARKQ